MAQSNVDEIVNRRVKALCSIISEVDNKMEHVELLAQRAIMSERRAKEIEEKVAFLDRMVKRLTKTTIILSKELSHSEQELQLSKYEKAFSWEKVSNRVINWS